jgi:CheY-like chemotaxis protein
MTRQELCVLVAQHDPEVSRRIGEELGSLGVRIAGPVTELERALARVESQVLSAAVVDLFLPGGATAIGQFRSRHPSLPVIATAPRRFESRARKAVIEGARLYLLDEELGRGLLAPVLFHVAGVAERDHPVGDTAATSSRRLLHDLGNLLAVASGESEMLLAKLEGENPLAEDLRELNSAITESTRLFRQFVALRRVEAAGPGGTPP